LRPARGWRGAEDVGKGGISLEVVWVTVLVSPWRRYPILLVFGHSCLATRRRGISISNPLDRLSCACWLDEQIGLQGLQSKF
jgi:hypothetical protein